MKYLALTGGVGGAKLALGLAKILTPDEVQFVVNTGDDFEHLGFHVSPDVDTLTYTLAEVANTDTGWGRAGETWQFIEAFDSSAGRAGSSSATATWHCTFTAASVWLPAHPLPR